MRRQSIFAPAGFVKVVIARSRKGDAAIPEGIKTPKHEIDLIKDRIKRLKEILR